MPVQRIPRYELLLKEIKKHTPDYHNEAEITDKCLAKINSIANDVNDKKMFNDLLIRMIQIENIVSVIDPSRSIIRKKYIYI